ncbi:MAG TPA: NAD(P)H-dependent glycerol-3-phosphate dehydrogenase [Candidatus Polarisedimenticolaceae bacterium]
MTGPVTIVGGGAWGTALAVHLGLLGRDVLLWMRESDLVARMRERRDNPAYLPGFDVPASVRPTDDLAETLRVAGPLVLVVPTPFARAVYRSLAPGLDRGRPVVIASKGIEEETLALPTDVAEQELGAPERLAVISGPSFAAEVAGGRAAAIVAAAREAAIAARVQEALSGGGLRLYTNDDVVGVQVAGALKNVIAIAAGVVEGLGLGHNALAALVTRGIAEMRRLGVAMGGRAETFSGLAGLGDLVLTCTGSLSRNRQVGIALARGERIEDILATTRHVAEGVRTCESALALARRHGVEMPIVEEVHRILHDAAVPAEAVRRLMTRPLTGEFEAERRP